MAEQVRETEFDMSVATLMRINELIRLLHKISLDKQSLDNKTLYISTLDRLFMECSTKMSDPELETADEHQTMIYDMKIKWGKDLYCLMYRSGKPNLSFGQAWGEMTFICRQYELFLMKTLERHGMLMKDKARIEDSLV